jgi:SAM-dependent methyltransferase
VLQDEYEIMYAQELQHWWFRGRRRVLVDLLRHQASACNVPLRILDFGCGTGGNLASYARFGSVIGVEPDPRAVQLAATRARLPLTRGSGTDLPFLSSSFDVVVASDVLEHIEDDARAVAEIARVLRPGGAFIFTVPAHPWLFGPHDRALFHYRRYVERDLRTLMRKQGLQISRLSYWNTLLFPLLAPLRVLGRLKRNRVERSEVKVPPTLVNELLTEVLALEAALLRRVRLPWGLSLLGVAFRP